MSPDEGIDAPPLTELHPVADVGVVVEHRTSGHRWEWTGKEWTKITPENRIALRIHEIGLPTVAMGDQP